jgi:predicted nucleic acid-binding protein
VIHELLRGAKRPEEREFALDLAANLRLYTPTERIWQDSGDIVARLASAKNYEKRKIQELSFDVLIALTARSIGATVITLIMTTLTTSNDIDDFGSSLGPN